MGKLIYAPEAKLEIKEAAAYYEGCKEGLGRAFLKELESAIDRLSQSPFRWRKIRGQFRRCLLKRFPYGVIYLVDEDEIFIAAVMHLKRKPGYWKGRIR
ncbi:type II toxin-antitoxin system RelE/ParE family toxin [candidate division KSB1 bacterium]|nr:type II toxin-antitoxin system RelE/ParE family toxin [candidate division KSB1 bacterium]NIR71882.1 type II toxin-antitoxin system RelE/ParE family toxin [candidate division KSB1 bacterium]NIS26449.1 type II toxin-antitoxin system RelE/ParE family toxin [candidate division KSB1 bacterium]NIT73219.1 type II toxin-antitoxin system RelE/ParE family toxin [candidate division KSB1 bacterium]NIU27133.1 type II toxin-antitoxin system RelE/ParE family toxin [candidate division KSB1 bacterium]